jgi:Outer membrane protein Omp28
MKKFIFPSLIAIVAASVTSCDKIEDPIKPAILLDTTLFPGNWEDYPGPVFTSNTNTDRNVLLEDYTGHRCPNCPAAAEVAKTIEAGNPTRVFVASVHAGPGGLSSFQNLASDCGTITNPEDEYCTVFYNNESIAYGAAFNGGGFGFIGNPQGTVNRVSFAASTMFQFSTEWQTRVDELLTANDLKVNIQAQSNYYTETNGMYLHVETEFLQDLTGGDYSLVVYLLEDQVEDFQDNLSVVVEDYEHHNVFRGCLDDLAWGQSIIGTHAIGEKTYFDYSYELPTGKVNTDYHLLIYVYDVATFEILQVIKHEF